MNSDDPNSNDGIVEAEDVDMTVGNQQVQAAMGTPSVQVQAAETFLVSMLIDDSGSIKNKGNEEVVKEGHNKIIKDLKSAPIRAETLAHARFLNGESGKNGDIIYPFSLLEDVDLLDYQNYCPRGGTPLFDRSIDLVQSVLAKVEEFEQDGVPARTITLIVTDGNDNRSVDSLDEVAKYVNKLHDGEDHVVCAMGIDDGMTDFRRVFKEMGIQENWILTPGNSPDEIKRSFACVSKSAQRHSQRADVGGFGS